MSNVQLLRGATRAAVRALDTHGNFSHQQINLDIPPAAFFEPEPEPTTPLKPEPLKPAKPEPIKPEPNDEKAETDNTPEPEPEKQTHRNINAHRKFILLWAKLKR